MKVSQVSPRNYHHLAQPEVPSFSEVVEVFDEDALEYVWVADNYPRLRELVEPAEVTPSVVVISAVQKLTKCYGNSKESTV